jgi:putative ABC transport system substrate-binding protein
LALPIPARAQQAKKVPLIGHLSGNDPTTDFVSVEGIRAALRALGYIEGQNIAFEYRYGEGKRDRAAEFAVELVRLKVDVIVVQGGDSWIRAAMNATKTIPIVLSGQGGDPVKQGFIESLAHPGGNVTGITSLTTELGGKRLEILRDAVPKVSRVAVLYDPTTQGNIREVKEELPVAARALKLTLRNWELRDADSFEKVFAALRNERPGGLYLRSGGPLIGSRYNLVTSFALKSRIPSMYSNKASVEAGGLMYYGADVTDSYRQIAWYVGKILKGSKAAELPVQQPMKFEFVINKKTADQIGLTIPQWTLMKATKVIQ